MKVFLSWSGVRSREVADALKEWLSCVIQAVKPWVSTQDIDRGALWFNEIGAQLQDTAVGIICLTKENKERPWILFEAGALAKGLSSSRVCTFLIDLQPADVREPLSQFNHTLPNKESLLFLVRTLNNALGEHMLDHKVLDQVFATYYPQFEKKFEEILRTTEEAPPDKPKNKDDLLLEILSVTRGLTNRLGRIEQVVQEPRVEVSLDSDPVEAKGLNRHVVETRIRKLMTLGASRAAIEADVKTRYKGVLPDVLIEKALIKQFGEFGG